MKLFATGVLIAALTLAAPSVHADSNDAVFLRTLNDGGIHGNPSGVINLGHKVCDGLAAGASPAMIEQTMASNGTDSFHLSFDQAGFLVGASVGVYCPGYAPNIN